VGGSGSPLNVSANIWNKGSGIFVFTVTDRVNAAVMKCHVTTVMRLGDV
jgi:hypothetical protein